MQLSPMQQMTGLDDGPPDSIIDRSVTVECEAEFHGAIVSVSVSTGDRDRASLLLGAAISGVARALRAEPKPKADRMAKWLQLDWSRPDASLAREAGVSRQRIGQIRHKLRQYPTGWRRGNRE